MTAQLPLVTPDEMRTAEAATVAAGTPERELMRRAATLIADWVCATQTTGSAPPHVVGLIGPGNNGGDALVCLALLASRGWRASALLAAGSKMRDVPASPHALRQVHWANEVPQGADVILDGVFGIGSRAQLPGSISDLFKHVTQRNPTARRVAIDVPSGTNAATGAAAPDAFQAQTTLCLGLPKRGLTIEPAASVVGEMLVLDIGIAPSRTPASAPRLLSFTSMADELPQRRASAHKHGTGTLLIVGGSAAYYGAPRLSADAALRSGCGLVTLAVPPTHVAVIATQLPEATFCAVAEDSDPTVALGTWAAERGSVSAILAGPGMGRDDRARTLLLATLTLAATNQTPVVLDADALYFLATDPEVRSVSNHLQCILTPHMGELARLLGESRASVERAPMKSAQALADRTGHVVVGKSGFATVATRGGCDIAPRAVPELATAGTGDVLAGLIAGLLAQTGDPLRSARVGISAGAMAGLVAREAVGPRGVVASDVAGAVPHALRILAEQRDPRMMRWPLGNCLSAH